MTLQDRPMQLWGGVECTVNRVGDRYLDQLTYSGHHDRITDLDRFAALGIRAVRYPVLWERTAPDDPAQADWPWADARLKRLHELAITPIVGLVHHGSGPRHTSLLEPSFAEGLARFAGAVAERYPWVTHYTPVNEPLTTARFSGLYGHWYPHAKDGLSFVKALLNQCRAVVLSMQAIRQVNPHAKLVQTEDLGKTHSTPLLGYQAEFENERRWLTSDLLCGRVNAGHPMWGYLRWVGVKEDALAWFLENPCPPDILGFNHYLTSERFLDERLERYPAWTHGTNGKHHYADVEAVRVLAEGLTGSYGLLGEAWARYGLPLAVTEVHLGCTREEQLRWLAEVWSAAQQLRQEGVDLRAVTVWSLLGAYDWDSLLTQECTSYEPGVFDLRGPEPRPTALARLMRELAQGRTPDHPVLEQPGWWRRADRLLYPPCSAHPSLASAAQPRQFQRQTPEGRPLLIVTTSRALGKAIARACNGRGLSCRIVTGEELQAAPDHAALLATAGPWAVVHAAPMEALELQPSGVTPAERDLMMKLGETCAARNLPFLFLSSSQVYDGLTSTPYTEADPPSATDAFGMCLAEAEARLASSSLVLRTGPIFGIPKPGPAASPTRRPVLPAGDALVSPTYLPDLIRVALDLLLDEERGIWHLTHAHDLALSDLLELLRDPTPRSASQPLKAPDSKRHACPNRTLRSSQGQLLPPFAHALERYRIQMREQLTYRS